MELKTENKHWVEQIADEIIEKKKEPFVVSAGITTSGPTHLGTLCEFLYPGKIREILIEKGKDAKFYFFADIMDAFDSIPVSMQEYEKELAPHLGKPLCFVPDPTGKSKSFGDHFLNDATDLMKKFGVDAEVVRMNDVYSSGKPDSYAKMFLENEEQAKEIVERTSLKQEKREWSAIMPICEKCGKIATTRVLSHDSENYEYVCDKDVGYTKGCGFKGKNSIYDHKYKITWRLHWPMWMDAFGTSYEGAGVDHFTRGGSRDTLEAVFKEMFKKEPPLGYRYGFILFQGRKYSKSKGIGMGASELMTLLPPEVIAFILVRPDLGENKDINPTKENMVKMIEEYEQSQEFAGKNPSELDRAARKRAMAYKLAGKRHWNVPFRDALMYHAIYNDWNKTGEMLGDAEGVEYIKPYVEEWVQQDLVPDEFNFKYMPKKAEGLAKEFIESLADDADALAIHNAVFNFANEKGVKPAELFKEIYTSLIGKERGPRLGKFIFALGVKRVKEDVL
ncbi:lysine--tRNA ligase [Candidatus Micrarchaeota archaeon]|nr:lysine--tRNA ligase [Candidatus Micrarchaeota archaeon]